MTRETNENTPVANRKFKDTIFRMLFSEKEALLSLYNAVNSSNYTRVPNMVGKDSWQEVIPENV